MQAHAICHSHDCHVGNVGFSKKRRRAKESTSSYFEMLLETLRQMLHSEGWVDLLLGKS